MSRKTKSNNEKTKLEKCPHDSKECQCSCCKVEFCRMCFAQHEIDRESERFRVKLNKLGEFQDQI